MQIDHWVTVLRSMQLMLVNKCKLRRPVTCTCGRPAAAMFCTAVCEFKLSAPTAPLNIGPDLNRWLGRLHDGLISTPAADAARLVDHGMCHDLHAATLCGI
jgi:hypothetical protein